MNKIGKNIFLNNYKILYGYQTFFYLKMWKPIIKHNIEGGPAIYYKNKIFILYGKSFDIINDYENCSDMIMEYDINSKKYKEIDHSEGPPERKFHTCNLYQDSIIFFGGDSFFTKASNETYIFNLTNFEWKKIICQDKIYPPGRRYHSSTIHQDHLYIFGGQSNSFVNDGSFFKDFWCLDLKNSQWKEIKSNNPETRRYFSFHTFGNFLYIFGGRDDAKRMNDLWKYDIYNNKWVELNPKGYIPTARSGHSSVIYENSIFLFGGNDGKDVLDDKLYEYNILLNEWKVLDTTKNPRGRFWHCSCVDHSQGILYIFGGNNSNDHFEDGHCIQLEKPTKSLTYSIYNYDFHCFNDVEILTDQ